MSAKRLLLAEQWDSYARRVMPRDAGTSQRMETRRAFYAGAQGLFQLVMANLSPDRDPTPEDLVMMQDLEAELRAYVERVKAGTA